MINFSKACEIAYAYYRDIKGIEGVFKPYELEDCWVFNGGRESDGAVGVGKIAVSKQDGAVSAFVLPSKDNFKRLAEGTEVELPEQYRQ